MVNKSIKSFDLTKILTPLFIFLISLIIYLSINPQVNAQEKAAGSSAAIIVLPVTSRGNDNRAAILREYLRTYDSPLAESADTFVKNADTYNLDWKFVAAISGLESTFGHHIPQNSYNAWGWGVYGNKVTYFKSFDDGIEVISKGLRERYMDSWGAQNTYQIGKLYAASTTWAQRVEYFMKKIDEFAVARKASTLPISI